jgi:chromosomal replication initiation ATPase DnaA
MIHPNIFIPRNDWNVRSMFCRRSGRIYDSFEKELAKEIKNEIGVSPLEEPKYRGGKNVQARQLFLVMMTLHTNRTYESIGSIIGKDHATVNHSIKSVQNWYDTDKRFRAMYDRIDQRIKLIN